MRLERLTSNKIKIFLTSDDLTERGLSKEDIWLDSLKWHQLFHDMLEEASEEFGVDFHGSVAVEIFSLQAQGMIMIVTVEEQSEEEESLSDSFIEMQVMAEDSDNILFEFAGIEVVIQLASRLAAMKITGGSLYAFNDYYYLLMDERSITDANQIIPILAEYGNPSLTTIHRLQEYGKEIILEKAVETLVHYFEK
ncbi:adaptor protein [Bacillus canaveralius]|uniref:Adaptor protein n=1 Tax=Bacillus canaveralius TaxID=1403243 RepID=A0A2N5GRS7_9BACI|nr:MULTISPECIES: genetic competence negative regulator [Bacillus]PLR84599.1 adaptor protein [Bacillus sp. V33-4]PLR86113.1 adaptor protein [Bacillus canaveralius]PLS00233.1 adaptor protein [Bacillus canaveralius]RSK52003.1 genetic competence negative regulator [Bacillus canaveralius]